MPQALRVRYCAGVNLPPEIWYIVRSSTVRPLWSSAVML